MCHRTNRRLCTPWGLALGSLLAIAQVGAPAGGAFAAPKAATTNDPAPAATAPELKPGGSFTLEFPDLPEDRRGEPAKVQVLLPTRYDPAQSYGLYVWLGGGDGGHHANANVVDRTRFVCAGFPYPKGANNPKQANMVGDFPAIWAYHRPMLQELLRVVPNIHPRLRIIGGFSNGGHCIDGLLSVPSSDFRRHFGTVLLADGGVGVGDYRGLSFAAMFWGEQSPAKRIVPRCAALAKSAGVTLLAEEMPGVGHAFPREHEQRAAKWIEQTVVAAVVRADLASAQAAVRANRSAEAFKLLGGLRALATAEADTKKTAELHEKLEAQAQAELTTLIERLEKGKAEAARRAAMESLASFRLKAAGTAAAGKATELVSPWVMAQLDALQSDAASKAPSRREPAQRRIRFIAKDWVGTPVGERCAQMLSGSEP